MLKRPHVVPMMDTVTFLAMACWAMLSMMVAMAPACCSLETLFTATAPPVPRCSSSVIGPREFTTALNGSLGANVKTSSPLFPALVLLRTLSCGEGGWLWLADDSECAGDTLPAEGGRAFRARLEARTLGVTPPPEGVATLARDRVDKRPWLRESEVNARSEARRVLESPSCACVDTTKPEGRRYWKRARPPLFAATAVVAAGSAAPNVGCVSCEEIRWVEMGVGGSRVVPWDGAAGTPWSDDPDRVRARFARGCCHHAPSDAGVLLAAPSGPWARTPPLPWLFRRAAFASQRAWLPTLVPGRRAFRAAVSLRHGVTPTPKRRLWALALRPAWGLDTPRVSVDFVDAPATRCLP